MIHEDSLVGLDTYAATYVKYGHKGDLEQILGYT